MEAIGLAGTDLLALMPGLSACKAGGQYKTLVWDGKSPLPQGVRTHTLIQPDDAAANRLEAPQVITCGSYHGDTLAVSSALEAGMASLQREILRMDGSVCTPCEVALGGFRGTLQQRLLQAALMLRQGTLP